MASQESCHREFGSARALRGRVYELLVFVSGTDGDWSREEKDALIQDSYASHCWILQQADRYGITLEFVRGGVLGLDADLKVASIPEATGSGKEFTGWTQQMLAQVGWDSYKLEVELRREHLADQVHAVVAFRREGRSYAMGVAPMHGHAFEGVALYLSSHDPDRAFRVPEIAHELLHLYGAWDLYKCFGTTQEQAREAARLFPDDIMHTTWRPIEELEIGPLTAWRIGWSTEREAWFDYFRPEHERG